MSATQLEQHMVALKRLCLFLALLSVGFSALPSTALARAAGEARCAMSGCCCEENCGCSGHAPSSSQCEFRCRESRLPVSLQPAPPVPTAEWGALVTLETYFLALKPVQLHLADLSMPAGWVLPHSPPLCSHVLNLPPPTSSLS